MTGNNGEKLMRCSRAFAHSQDQRLMYFCLLSFFRFLFLLSMLGALTPGTQ